MPTLIRSERQTLRAIQDHMLSRRRQAGAAYTQISTVGVIYHPDDNDPAMNVVTPHQGVAWARGSDLRQGFELLGSCERIPRLQYLEGLFPEAFARQLALHGLQLESEIPIWIYTPIQGPFPEGETPFGRLLSQEQTANLTIQEVTTQAELATWLRVNRSARYGVDVPHVPFSDIVDLEYEFERGDSVYIMGYYHDTPVATAQISLGATAAEILEPMVIWPWTGLGFEQALLAFTVHLLQRHSYQNIYIAGRPSYDMGLYLRLGFLLMTQIITFVSASADKET